MAGRAGKCFDDPSGTVNKTLMSRGLGQKQRAVLDAFKANPGSLLDSITVTALVSGSGSLPKRRRHLCDVLCESWRWPGVSSTWGAASGMDGAERFLV